MTTIPDGPEQTDGKDTHGRKWARLHVISDAIEIKKHREQVAERVFEFYEQNVPIARDEIVLCFLDDKDLPELEAAFGGVANRGIHWPIRGQGLVDWPMDMWHIIAPPDSVSGRPTWPFTSVIYLHGGTCQTDIGLTLTLAHELQHFIQFVNHRRLWVVNILLGKLSTVSTEDLKVWWDLPIEKESRIVSKRIAESIFGEEPVKEYIAERINDRITDHDASDWEFVQSLDVSIPYSPLQDTTSLQRKYRVQLKQLQLTPEWQGDSDFSSIDFDRDE